ncbi:hypothetical protein PsorP6_016402 [Peronosclerospora sorghi]|uniref:Uncharacterized protein n=1 Tax=Peronosclerospora sorghi TaxID=230839 RepID=A0ACC0VKQ5_9STRA|nr:hypothetical protein PsorP6_016402 [Peronosclerospora sorghi]
MLQREIIAAKEMEGKLDGSASSQGKSSGIEENMGRGTDSRSLVETGAWLRKRMMQHMVDMHLMMARGRNSSTLRDEAVLLHLLRERECEMGVV